jgi:hypothetical protein
MRKSIVVLLVLMSVWGLACTKEGPRGPAGPQGPQGPQGPVGPTGEVTWIHVTLGEDNFTATAGGYWVTIANSALHGDYAAIVYYEANDGSWFTPPPMYTDEYGWYLLVYAYDGAIVFKHVLYAVGDRVHIAVVSSEQGPTMPMVLMEHPMSD